MSNIKLSVIITAHCEGFFAHKTMRSIFECLIPFDQKKIPYEIIVHIDNGDKITTEYFSRYQSDPRVRIFKNHFGDLGLSRNFCIQESRGEFIAIADGDDLYSDNWLVEAYKIASHRQSPIIIHPAACLTFGIGTPHVISFNRPSSDKTTDAIALLGENLWGSPILAPRQVFLDYPYIVAKNGYGYEDFYFNTTTVAYDIEHVIAPETMLFYRRGNQSLLDSSNEYGAVQPYSKLFDEVRPALDGRHKTSVYSFMKRVYHALLRITPMQSFLQSIAYRITHHTTARSSYHLSASQQFVLREWGKINHIETLLCPSKDAVASLQLFDASKDVECGLRYYELMRDVSHKPDYIFIVPWVATGGADKVLINYAKAIRELRPSSRIMVITTLMSDNQFRKFLPDNVDFIDFGNLSCDLHPFFKDRLFSRLITQSQCRKVHIINAEYAFQWVKNHLNFAKHELDLRISTFNYDFVADVDGCVFDYNDMYLPLIYPAIKHIYTDNHRVLEHISTQCGIDVTAKATVHYQPIPIDDIQPIVSDALPHRPLRILWASRVVKQKAPELLAKIARALPQQDFHIDMYGAMSAPYSVQDFQCPALTYCGPYDGIANLDTTQYDIFLYTSLGDGMPNILLEMVARGLPVVASDVGGIGELIKDGQTGTLIIGNDPEHFISALRDARSHYDKYIAMAMAAQTLLKTQHDEAKFIKNVKKMIL